MKFKGKDKAKGITLIALVITIIIMIILAGVSINAIVGDNGIITRSMEASFKAAASQYKEDTDAYVVTKQVSSSNYSATSIFAGDTSYNSCFKSMYNDIYLLFEDTENAIAKVPTNITSVTNMDDSEHLSHFAVYEGELTWFTSYAESEDNEVYWCLDLGIQVWVDGYGFKRSDGTYQVGSEGEYTLQENGEYLCSPDLSGFNTGSTYYVTYASVDGEEEIGDKIYEDAPSGWYSYNSTNSSDNTSTWANIVTSSNGRRVYMVWIPRYAYKVTNTKDADSTAIDIKFINTSNNYINSSGVEVSATSAGYIVPDAFTFGNTEAAGIWVTKYEITDPREPVGFTADADYDSITINEITWSNGTTPSSGTSTSIENANVVITISGSDRNEVIGQVDTDGNIVEDSNSYEDSEGNLYDSNGNLISVSLPYTIEDLSPNTKYTITVTTPTYYIEDLTVSKTIRTTEGSVADITNPDLSGFDLTSTYYVIMDSSTPTIMSGDDYSPITTTTDSIDSNKKIASNAPDGWYNYSASSKSWANIVTIGSDGSASYWVWIPRYAYSVDTSQNTVDIVFISANTTSDDLEELDLDDYLIPDAFTYDGIELSGIWVSKYEIEEISLPTGLNTQTSDGNLTITEILYENKSTVSSGSMPNYGTLTVSPDPSGGSDYTGVDITIDSTKGYTIKGLKAGTTYTISLVVPYAYSNPVTGSSVSTTVETTIVAPSATAPNEPDVSQFINNGMYAYYVYFPSNLSSYGTDATRVNYAILGGRITSTSYSDSSVSGYTWYDYSSKNWANILVSDTDLKDYVGETIGSIPDGSTTTFSGAFINVNMYVWIPRYEYKVAKDNSIQLNFLSGTSKTTSSGYYIPDAFSFGNDDDGYTELTGIWVSKYEVSNGS